jgi:hypothetical protein
MVGVAANGTNNDGGADLLKFAGDMEGVNATLAAKDANGALIPMTSANKGQDTSAYDPFQKEQACCYGRSQVHHSVPRSRHSSRLCEAQLLRPAIQNMPTCIQRMLHKILEITTGTMGCTTSSKF